MNSSNLKPLFTSYGYELAFILQLGGYYLENLYKNNDRVFFSEWSNKVNEAITYKLDDKQLRWLWKTITTEPLVQKHFQKGKLISYNEELKLRKVRIPVLPKGEVIAIFLRNYLKEENPIADIESLPHPDGKVILNSNLEMQPGKDGFFECCEVEAELNFQVNQIQSIEQEAKFLELSSSVLKIIAMARQEAGGRRQEGRGL
ncbi:hypothetical protein [Nostoc sp. MS1]|uniref:hypothetical protein n=1 Tax=Nostoc sp. MS1 TaxID=2764711 RepID=UPI001CC820A0|nr:hypothetical protein [Nostoc sp. MS1]BCL40118.1 hypothetical protein NSMS1_65650 [Nostoc sp. MS1]